ncbi:MAG: EAL domain-containing protein [Anaerolineales bacterium]|uniref:EAL domain-containing protein n=1 Tax=Candidatus Desulfolinea nitratireducens TaxID=2841698 RepID=A0A8J6TJJ3_9CHLR|nr:EAL domain-containing protein [Candidatus Desulfolinea nitratireducens]MBL6960471.1 EAL domain-containing protein [Anaerolineales bacterium]
MAENTGKIEWLLITRSTNNDLQKYSIEPGQNTIGREADNTIVLHDDTASSYHAKIEYDPIINKVSIQDFDSTNGTFVNGNRINRDQPLHHDDRIRFGICLFTIIQSGSLSHYRPYTNHLRNKVTTELILESNDHYGHLLYDVGQRLVNISDLEIALSEISELIKGVITAEDCQIIMANQFEKLTEKGIPSSIAQKAFDNKTATLFSNNHDEFPDSEENSVTVQSKAPLLLVPVIIDDEVVALIFARKSIGSSTNFYNRDLQLVLAISNQVAMSIQRNQIQTDLLHNSHHDALTGLPNRKLFLDSLNQSIAQSRQRKAVDFAVLFLDIDDFKVVNDSLGHGIGDQLLLAVAERLKKNIHSVDADTQTAVIARFGGDEFAILLNDVKESLFSISTANRLREALSKPFIIKGKQIFATVSIGVAVSTIGYESPEDILQDADIAMYQAKELGKARVEIYDKSMRDRALERMRIGTALRQGVLQKEFRLHYQPIISMETGHIAGYEALMRWYAPNKGILYPSDFMDSIDTAGLIYTTDHWALQNACTQAVEWQKKFPSNPPLFIAVNLSARNIKHPNLVENVKEVLEETKLEPDRLWLEITEKVSAPDDESAIEVLKKLRSLGIRISLDDFGSGYSALNYLARFPIDVLKIDRSFVKMIHVDKDSQKIIEMIKTLASHLRLDVIAEGVEKAEQKSFLQSINCEYAQGYYYAKPLDAISATELLASRRKW